MRKISLLLGIIAIPLMTMATEPEKKAGKEKETSKVEKSEKKGCSSSEKEQSSRCCAGKKPA